MNGTFLLYLLILASTTFVVMSTKYYDKVDTSFTKFDVDETRISQDYNGPWGAGVQCPSGNPPFPNGTTNYKGSVPSEMTTDAVNYLRDANVQLFQVSDIKTYSNLPDLYFIMRKEFHTWHYSGGQLLNGCWKGVTVYQYIDRP